MVDDFFDPNNPDVDCHTCDVLRESSHKLIEFVVDPGSEELSASRAMFILANIGGVAAAVALVWAGLKWEIHQAFTPASVIFTGLVASNATVYFASTRKPYRCNERQND